LYLRTNAVESESEPTKHPFFWDNGQKYLMFQIIKQCMERLRDYLANCSAKIKAIKGVFTRVGMYIQRGAKIGYLLSKINIRILFEYSNKRSKIFIIRIKKYDE
jgi:hypothetical protein